MICNQEFPNYRTDLSNLYILTISLVFISPVLNRYLKTWSGFWFLVFLSTPLSESKHRSLWLTITLEHHNSVLSTAKLSSIKIIQPLHFYLYCMCKTFQRVERTRVANLVTRVYAFGVWTALGTTPVVPTLHHTITKMSAPTSREEKGSRQLKHKTAKQHR